MTIQSEQRQREIAQGLRDESGSLIGGLYVLEYAQGHEDWSAGTPPPPVTTTSYDLGRARAARQAELAADVRREIDERSAASRVAVRELLAHRPDLLAEYDAKMAELDARK